MIYFVTAVVRKTFESATECQVENIVSSWFRFVKDRDGGRTKRLKVTK